MSSRSGANMKQGSPPEADSPFDLGASGPSLQLMERSHARYGDVYRVYVPRYEAHTYVVHHPRDIRRILVTNHRNYEKGAELDRVKILLGDGLMTSEGATWRRRRSMMQPLFQRHVIARLMPLLVAANERFMARMEEARARDEPVNVTAETSDLVLQIILQFLFGQDAERLSAEFARLLNGSARDAMFAYKFRSLDALVRDLIRERKTRDSEGVDHLSMLMGARDKSTGSVLSEGELIDELLTLVVAGHETTASCLNLAWHLLSQHAEVESRLHREIDTVCPDAPQSIEQLEELKFARRFFDEVLRLYPPGWLLSRRTIAADSLGGYEIPPRTNVLLPLFLVHRDARFWREPDTFQPERFLSEGSSRLEAAYLPFAAGPRHCIGEYMATCEMLMHIASVARRYRLLCTSPDLKLHTEINLRTSNSFFMNVVRR